MTTRQITYYKKLDSISSGDDNITLSQSLQFTSQSSRKKLKLVAGTVSRSIPNIFNYNGENNGLVAVKRNIADDWTEIQLDNGIYNVSDITNAINKTIGDSLRWYTDNNEPAIKINSNSVVQKCYITIDSSKLSAGGTQFCIKFNYKNSQMYKLLGFINISEFSSDGMFEGSDIAQVDYFGNLISIRLNGFGNLSILNNDISNEIATIDMNSDSNSNCYKIDTTSMFPVDISPPYDIKSYSVELVGSRNEKHIVFLEGEIKLTFQLIEE